jgi:group II intron reverse transcriptase/maturase
MGFLEELTAIPTLRRAWESVAAKRGVAGIDRVPVEAFGVRLADELERLSEEIRTGKYRPLPVLRIRPAFLAPSDRALVVPAVRDRVVQRAIADLLSPQIDPLLSPACRAFRKGSSARAAADDVGRWIEQGEAWVLRADVKSFFDSVQPDVLRRKLAPFVDEEGLRFLDRVLRCRIFDRDEVSEMLTGIAQGSPLSPLLGNLYLSELDAAVEGEFPKYVRYCDDLLVLGAREEDVVRARERIADLLAPLGLRLNEEKGRLCRAEDGFVFLGYHVLGYLSRKAERTSYLNHRERWSLLCALGHLGEEGRAALHSIIGHTYNYRREVTERNIERLPPWPISCPKLRELHPEAAAVGTCSCQFDLRGRGYPTPVLYALRPSEVAAFRQRKERETEKGEREKEASGGERQEAEDKVKKIAELKRHRRGIEAALDRLHEELAAVFEAAGAETLQLSVGVLRRVRREQGEGWDFVIEV